MRGDTAIDGESVSHKAGQRKAAQGGRKNNAQKKKKKPSNLKRIRDVKRLLARPNLPETIRVAQERILAALEEEHDQNKHSEKERKLSRQYRMVKFFERRKLMRKLASVQSRIAKGDGDTDSLTQQAEEMQRQLNYILHYPRDEKYISVLKPDDEVSEQARQRRQELLQSIQDRISAGELVLADKTSFAQFDAAERARDSTYPHLDDDANSDTGAFDVSKAGDATTPSSASDRKHTPRQGMMKRKNVSSRNTRPSDSRADTSSSPHRRQTDSHVKRRKRDASGATTSAAGRACLSGEPKNQESHGADAAFLGGDDFFTMDAADTAAEPSAPQPMADHGKDASTQQQGEATQEEASKKRKRKRSRPKKASK